MRKKVQVTGLDVDFFFFLVMTEEGWILPIDPAPGYGLRTLPGAVVLGKGSAVLLPGLPSFPPELSCCDSP